MTKLQRINAEDLICMNAFASTGHYRVDLAYATDNNLLFQERIYRKDAALWLHKALAEIVIDAASYCFNKHNLRFILYDGLRTTDAQAAMTKTRRVQENPHWLEPPRLLSPAGTGGHPRGMAIDIGLETADGTLIDMGTPFDYLAQSPHPKDNPAHRDHPHLSNEILDNRGLLNNSIVSAAQKHRQDITLLPEEWWDFRLPAHLYNQFAPLSDFDLPENMRLLDI